jgi:hypothetical protein
MLGRLIKSFVEKRAIRREMQRLRARLLDLGRYNSGRHYIWDNGAIHESWLHPTKGWRSRRVERFPLQVGGNALSGLLSLADVANPAEVRLANG